MHYVIPIVCRVPGEHGKGRNTHGKMFTVRNTWQTTHGIDRQAKGTFYRVYFCAHGKQISEKKPSHTFRHHCLPPPCPQPRRLELAPRWRSRCHCRSSRSAICCRLASGPSA